MSQEECPICLDTLELGGSAMFTAECGHKFHYTCLLENVNHDEANSDKCPICRQDQKEWPEPSKGLAKEHPYCTNCGTKGKRKEKCSNCGQRLVHTPTAQERARMEQRAAMRNNVVVMCPTCSTRCLVSTSARGTLQCPQGHLFQLRVPGTEAPRPAVVVACPTCTTRVQMPPGATNGRYLCPQGHPFEYRGTT